MMEDKIIEYVKELTKYDKSGHDINHVLRVYNLALKFANDEKNVDKKIIGIAALLHDVDDYKVVGNSKSKELSNAKYIMDNINLDSDSKDKVLDIIKNMGFKNSLKGIRPKTIEGKIVSDADMCDALGSTGIIRTIVYANNNIFDENVFPNLEINYLNYGSNDNMVNHFFEKLLKLPYMLFTESAKKEGFKRRKIMIDFLYNFFEENDCNEWINFLEEYLKNISNI